MALEVDETAVTPAALSSETHQQRPGRTEVPGPVVHHWWVPPPPGPPADQCLFSGSPSLNPKVNSPHCLPERQGNSS